MMTVTAVEHVASLADFVVACTVAQNFVGSSSSVAAAAAAGDTAVRVACFELAPPALDKIINEKNKFESNRQNQ
jgi:hypothetical protein